MDSIRRFVVLFKPVTIPTSDPKSEFLCQLSFSCAELADPPPNTSYTWDISHTLVTTYHPYCHSPSALTEYLKQKLRHQRAKCLGRSLSTQVKLSVQLEHNTTSMLPCCIAFLDFCLKNSGRDKKPLASICILALLCLWIVLSDFPWRGAVCTHFLGPSATKVCL